MNRLCTIAILLALAVPAFAMLPIPVVTYNAPSATLRAVFMDETTPLPPSGFAKWDVSLILNGEWVDFYDSHATREVTVVVSPPLDPGGYFIIVKALDADGAVIDSTPLFDFTYALSMDYRGVLPRIAVGYGWNTSVAMTNHVSSQPIPVYFDLYYEDGTFLETVEGTIPPHGSAAFYFDVSEFTGSAEIRSTAPLSFVYLAAGPDGLSYSFMGKLEN